MLVRADGLGSGLEPSTSLGADRPRLPAAPLFFQHPGECHALAAAVGVRSAFLVFPRFGSHLLFRSRGHGSASAIPPDAVAKLPRTASRPRLAAATNARGYPSL